MTAVMNGKQAEATPAEYVARTVMVVVHMLGDADSEALMMRVASATGLPMSALRAAKTHNRVHGFTPPAGWSELFERRALALVPAPPVAEPAPAPAPAPLLDLADATVEEKTELVVSAARLPAWVLERSGLGAVVDAQREQLVALGVSIPEEPAVASEPAEPAPAPLLDLADATVEEKTELVVSAARLPAWVLERSGLGAVVDAQREQLVALGVSIPEEPAVAPEEAEVPPSEPAAVAEVDDPDVAPTLDTQRPANRERFAEKNPAPGMRLCTMCGPEKGPLPVGEFNIKNKKTGNRMPWCKACGRLRSRKSYVAAAEMSIVTFARAHLKADSVFIGEACPDCGTALQVGDEVEGCDITLRHVSCPLGAAEGPGAAPEEATAGTATPPPADPEGPRSAPLVAASSGEGFVAPVLGWTSTDEEVRWHAAGDGRPALANGHVEIWGTSGAGKTQAIQALLAQLARGCGTRIGIADFKNDYGHENAGFPDAVEAEAFNLWRGGLPLNPLALDTDDPRSLDGAVIEIRDAVATAAASFTRMGHIQQDRMRALLEDAYFKCRALGEWPTFEDLDEMLAADAECRPCERRYVGLSSILGDLSRNRMFLAGPPLGQVIERNMVFGLADIPGNGLTTVLAAGFILSSIMLRIQASEPRPNTIGYALVVDEAHRVSRFKAIDTMIREGRSKGLALILATQQPTDSPEIVGSNAATRICFRLPDAIAAAAAAKRLDPSDRALPQRIRALDVGQAFVRLGGGPLRLVKMAQLWRDAERLGAADRAEPVGVAP